MSYSKRTAHSISEKLQRKTEVAQANIVARNDRAEATKIDADRVLIELGRIAFFDTGKVFNADGSLKSISEMDENTRRAIVDISETSNERGSTRRLKFADKLRALELIGRHLAMFSEKVTLKSEPEDPLKALLMSIQGSSFPVVHKVNEEDSEEE